MNARWMGVAGAMLCIASRAHADDRSLDIDCEASVAERIRGAVVAEDPRRPGSARERLVVRCLAPNAARLELWRGDARVWHEVVDVETRDPAVFARAIAHAALGVLARIETPLDVVEPPAARPATSEPPPALATPDGPRAEARPERSGALTPPSPGTPPDASASRRPPSVATARARPAPSPWAMEVALGRRAYVGGNAVDVIAVGARWRWLAAALETGGASSSDAIGTIDGRGWASSLGAEVAAISLGHAWRLGVGPTATIGRTAVDATTRDGSAQASDFTAWSGALGARVEMRARWGDWHAAVPLGAGVGWGPIARSAGVDRLVLSGPYVEALAAVGWSP